MSIENVLIEDEDIQYANDIAESIKDDDLRNKVGKNALAVKISERFFNKNVYNTDIDSGLYKNASIVDKTDIADLYVNGVLVNVILRTDDSTIKIPQKNYDKLKPSIYMIIDTTDKYDASALAGFIITDEAELVLEGEYYTVDNDSLSTFYAVETYLSKIEDTFDVENEDIFNYIDGNLPNNEEFYQKLIKSKYGREKLLTALKAQDIYEKIAITDINTEDELDKLSNISELSDANEQNELNTEEEDFSVDDLFESQDNEETDMDLDSLYEQNDDNNESQTDNSDIVEEEVIEEQNEISEEDLYEYSTEASPSSTEIIESLNNEEDNTKTDETSGEDNGEQIDQLFDADNEEQNYYKPKKKKINIAAILVLVLAGASVGGYFFYNKSQDTSITEPPSNIQNIEEIQKAQKTDSSEAMPNETVNTVKVQKNNNEGNAVSIPAIEQNLDASILVTNLKVSWEVPSGYAANTAANRYLVKLGKIIQLNLKSELLLLNKPPITNVITVEIKFNESSKKFEAVGIVKSSGESSVDKLILDTVNSALSMDISVNTDSFVKLKGNPVLIIKL